MSGEGASRVGLAFLGGLGGAAVRGLLAPVGGGGSCAEGRLTACARRAAPGRPVIGTLRGDDVEAVRQTAVFSVFTYALRGSREARRVLLDLLANQREPAAVRTEVAMALGNFSSREVSKPLVEEARPVLLQALL